MRINNRNQNKAAINKPEPYKQTRNIKLYPTYQLDCKWFKVSTIESNNSNKTILKVCYVCDRINSAPVSEEFRAVKFHREFQEKRRIYASAGVPYEPSHKSWGSW